LEKSTIDVESARSLLSTLVQCQAAIISIVISLTLVALQVIASKYTFRVIEIFKKSLDIWILLILYIIGISFGCILLISIYSTGCGKVITTLNPWISFTLFYGIFTFVAIIPFMLNIIEFFKTKNMISLLRLNEKSVANSNEINDEKINSLCDIIHSSIMNYDISTTREGLEAITGLICERIGTEKQNFDSLKYCTILAQFGRLALSKSDEESVSEVLDGFEKISKELLLYGSDEALFTLTLALDEIGRSTAVKSLEAVTIKNIIIIGNSGEHACNKGFKKSAERIIIALGWIGKNSALANLESATIQSAKEIEKIGISACSKKDFSSIIRISIISLKEVTFAANRSGFESASQIVNIFGNIGNKITEPEGAENLSLIAESLGWIGKDSASKGYDATSATVTSSLNSLGVHAIEHKFRNCIIKVIVALGWTGKEAIINELSGTTHWTIEILENIGTKSIEKEYTEQIPLLCYSLSDIGKSSALKEMEDVVVRVVQSQENVGILIIERKLDKFTPYIINSLKEVAIVTLSKNLEKSSISIVQALGKFGTAILMKDPKNENPILSDLLGWIAKSACQNNLENLLYRTTEVIIEMGTLSSIKENDVNTNLIIEAISWIGESSVTNNLDNSSRKVSIGLRNIGKIVAENDLQQSTGHIINAIKNFAIFSIKQEFEEGVVRSIQSLESICTISAIKGKETEINSCIVALGWIGSKSASNDLEQGTTQSVMSLAEIAKIFYEKNNEYILTNLASTIGWVGRNATKKNYLDASQISLCTIIKIGCLAFENKFTDLNDNILRELFEITAINPFSIKKAMYEFEQTVEGSEQPFQQFKKHYISRHLEIENVFL
jgi:hypothetical protein